MPQSPADVGVDDIFNALEQMGSPTVFYAENRDKPGPEDMPMLVGALAAAVDRLMVHHGILGEEAARARYAAGYLQSVGAVAPTPCERQNGLAFVVMRAHAMEVLLDGYGGDVEMIRLMSLAARVAARFGLIHLGGPPDIVRRRLAEALTALSEIQVTLRRLQAAGGAKAAGDAAGGEPGGPIA